MCQQAKTQKKSGPFLNDYYEVKFFFQRPLSQIKYVETRICNAIVEGMNTIDRLPKYILIILDKDLIESLKKVEFGAKIMIENAIIWLIEKLEKAIYWRKDDIRSKCPGALTGHGEPRLIFVSIPERPRSTDSRKHEVFKLVTKANTTIENTVRKYPRFCHMMCVESVNEFIHFDYQGRLTPNGRKQYWKEIDEEMKRFDKKQTDLLPRESSAYRPQVRRAILKQEQHTQRYR